MFLSIIPERCDAATYGVTQTNSLGLSLLIEEGGDHWNSNTESITLSLDVSYLTESVVVEESLYLVLSVVSESGEGLSSAWPDNSLDLTLSIGVGVAYNIVWVWDPYDQPKLTGKNYTYECYVGLQGVPQEVHLVMRFEGSYVTEKDSNSTGQFDFWAIVGSAGIQTWSFTIYDEGEEQAIIYKDTEYVEGGPGPDPEPPPGPGPDIPDLPTAPGSLFGVFDALPLMVVFGVFGFIGNLIVGRVGVLFGAVAALFLTTAMGTLPSWVLYFVILVTIIVVAYKLKTGGSNVTVNNGGVSA